MYFQYMRIPSTAQRRNAPARGRGHAKVHETGIHGGPPVRLVGVLTVSMFVFGAAVLLALGGGMAVAGVHHRQALQAQPCGVRCGLHFLARPDQHIAWHGDAVADATAVIDRVRGA